MTHRSNPRSAWSWVPSLYFAQGIPNVIAMAVSVVMYKRLGISNTDIALYTGSLNLPWVFKPLWSPFIDMFGTKRLWIVSLQLLMSAALVCVALALPGPQFFRYTLAVFWVVAFASATHDIAADGFYMLGLAEHQQAAFSGIRSTFFRLANLTGSGLLVILAGTLENRTGRISHAWSITFGVVAAIFVLTALYHLVILPRPANDRPTARGPSSDFSRDFLNVFIDFFRKPNIIAIIGFILFFRFAEAQLTKLIAPFLLDDRTKGGLGMTTQQVGVVYGTVGVIALTAGGVIGGILVSRHGLRAWLWPMVLIMHVPDVAFVFLSQYQPTNFYVINAAVAFEQFGYGFGFTAYMLYMIMIAQGKHPTAHYAICTGFMALGMTIAQMSSGYVQEQLGYKHFFIWVVISTIPGFIVAALVRIEAGFGRRRAEPAHALPAATVAATEETSVGR